MNTCLRLGGPTTYLPRATRVGAGAMKDATQGQGAQSLLLAVKVRYLRPITDLTVDSRRDSPLVRERNGKIEDPEVQFLPPDKRVRNT